MCLSAAVKAPQSFWRKLMSEQVISRFRIVTAALRWIKRGNIKRPAGMIGDNLYRCRNLYVVVRRRNPWMNALIPTGGFQLCRCQWPKTLARKFYSEKGCNMTINKIAVIGSGVMGSGIAAQIANAGVPVVLLDIKLSR